ncbi:G5 domain-containing protein [Candidatus Berkelbacteria bacterium]|nr:G5 domain-containing protein [Candidatus Berkelbacteria bacterium]
MKKSKFQIIVFSIFFVLLSLFFVFRLIAPGEGKVLGEEDFRLEKLDTQIDYIDNHRHEVYFGKAGIDTKKAMLADLGAVVYPEDKISFFPEPEFDLGSKVDIIRANKVLIFDAENKTEFRTWAKNVEEALAEKEFSLGEKDILNSAKETEIKEGLEIKITRVRETEVFENITLPFKTIERQDNTLDKGKTKVIQEGKKGNKKITYLSRRENGKEVKKTKIKEEVTNEPQEKIVLIGTKEVVLGEGIATWYDWISGLTAASNTLPYGTKVKVTSLENRKEVVVTIIDHGIKGQAIIDLSADAFRQLAPLSAGIIKVKLTAP